MTSIPNISASNIVELIVAVNEAIVNGVATDEHIASIQRAFTARKEVAKAKMRVDLVVGQTVWFNEKVRPTYLKGAAATIKKINRERVIVDLVKPTDRFHKGVNVPLTLISTVEA